VARPPPPHRHPQEGKTATRHFAVGHPAADGHFPGDPIIPGAVLLREIVAAVRAIDDTAGDESILYDIRSAKFHQPVRPGDTLVISWTTAAGGDVRFSCVLAGSGQPAVTGALHPRKP
jgi:3-hydroxyacyl-[acyl-carrier-protein] dehydratase